MCFLAIRLIWVNIFQVRPQEVKANQGFSEDGKLSVEEGDHITVLEGR